MTFDLSTAESARFGLRVARWAPAAPDERIDPTGYDVVIVRRPEAWADRWIDLTRFNDHVAVHADTLLYWEWTDRGENIEARAEIVTVEDAPSREIETLVRDVFAEYHNHYRANPLFDPALVLAGYVEWALSTVDRVPGAFIGVGSIDELTGFGVIDWGAEVPDVRLAGVTSAARGQGWYGELVARMMLVARARGAGHLRISTQAQNLKVQRTWASFGWRQVDALGTTHLIRSELLEEGR